MNRLKNAFFSSTQQLEKIQDVLKEKLAAAILDPSSRNIEKYLEAKYSLAKKEKEFEEACDRALQNNPKLKEFFNENK